MKHLQLHSKGGNMQIDKKYKLEKAVSNDPTRTNLTNVYVTNHHAQATNGHILAIVPIKKEKDDTPGWLTTDALKLARKMLPKGVDNIQITLNGYQILPDRTTLARPNGELSPPKLFRILRQAHSNRSFKVGINASYLKELSEAIGAEEIALEFGKPDSAILVRPVHGNDGAVGLIMPVRLK
jgi:DNA polymerase III sliding clamp (beta) subunit (PCNA family)